MPRRRLGQWEMWESRLVIQGGEVTWPPKPFLSPFSLARGSGEWRGADRHFVCCFPFPSCLCSPRRRRGRREVSREQS